MKSSLGINTCFAVKRWPEPREWARIARDRLGLSVIQHSLDLTLLDAPPRIWQRQAREVREACAEFGLTAHSTFTGIAAYSFNLLLAADQDERAYWEKWYRRAIAFTALVGGMATGGHVGAFSVRDWRDSGRRASLERELFASLERLTRSARREGLQGFYVENLAAAREPSTMAGIESLLTEGDADHVPVLLCLDVGHQCVPGATGDDLDPYAWLRRFGHRAGMVQLQQSDAEADHHWPFTGRTRQMGRIDAGPVLAALEEAGADEVTLVLEVIPPFEQDDDLVLDELAESAEYWRTAIADRSGSTSR